MIVRRWLLAAWIAGLVGLPAVGDAQMKKQDHRPPLFVRGPSLEPTDALDRWLVARHEGGTRELVRLPVTIWREPSSPRPYALAQLGVAAARDPARALRLGDSALGISLEERLRMLCPAPATRCVLWMAGRYDPKARRLSLLEPPERVDDEQAATHVEVEHAASCFVVRSLRDLHCARGASRCAKCKAAEARPARPRLLDVCPEGDLARPVIDLERDGKVEHRVYDVLRTFADDAEARAFADRHGIDDVKLGA